MGKLNKLLASILTTFIVVGCNGINQPSKSKLELKSPDSFEIQSAMDSGLVSANTKFGLNLYSKILDKEKDKNIFLSPLSISIALSMTFNGADGATKEYMAKALQYNDLTLEDVNKGNNILNRKIQTTSSGVTVDIANSLWGKKSFTFPEKFIQDNKNYYGADLTLLDFGAPSSLTTINNWVSDNTNKKIEKILDKIDPATFLVLINAIYFKGTWTDEFKKDLTKEEKFTSLNNKEKNVPMMQRYGEYRYFEDSGSFQAIRLPYGEKEEVSMYVFLPAKESNLTEFHKKLNSENWDKWMSSFSKTDGNIKMPRFKTEYDISLNDSLKALGMESAFLETANFDKLGGGFISEVKHKTFVDVNEEGTEAAAVTAVVMNEMAMMPTKEFNMTVDRPFMFAIVDETTKSILFMGSIVDPQV